MPKLNYKIIGRRSFRVSGQPGATGNGATSPGTRPQADVDMDMVDVEWRHDDGFKPDQRFVAFNLNTVNQILDAILVEAAKQDILPMAKIGAIKKLVPVVFVPHELSREIGLLAIDEGTREVIADQVNVPMGCADSLVMQILEEKRPRLAAALKVEP